MRKLYIEDMNENIILDLNQNFGDSPNNVFAGDTTDMNAVLLYDTIQGMTNLDARYAGDNFIKVKCRFQDRSSAFNIFNSTGLLTNMSSTRYYLHYNNGTTDFRKVVLITHVDVVGENAYYWESELTLFDLYGVWDVSSAPISTTGIVGTTTIQNDLQPNIVGRTKTSSQTFKQAPQVWASRLVPAGEAFAPFSQPMMSVADGTQLFNANFIQAQVVVLNQGFIYYAGYGKLASFGQFNTGDTAHGVNVDYNGASVDTSRYVGLIGIDNATAQTFIYQYDTWSGQYTDITSDCTITWTDLENGTTTTQVSGYNIVSTFHDTQTSSYYEPIFWDFGGLTPNTGVNWIGGNALMYPVNFNRANYYHQTGLSYFRNQGGSIISGVCTIFNTDLTNYDNLWLVDGVPYASNGNPFVQTNITNLTTLSNPQVSWTEQTLQPDGTWGTPVISNTAPTGTNGWGAPMLNASTMGDAVWGFTWTNIPTLAPSVNNLNVDVSWNADSSNIEWDTISLTGAFIAGNTYLILTSPQVVDLSNGTLANWSALVFTPSVNASTVNFNLTTQKWDTVMSYSQWCSVVPARQTGANFLTDVQPRLSLRSSIPQTSISTVATVNTYGTGGGSTFLALVNGSPTTFNVTQDATLTGTETEQSFYAI